LKSLIAARVRWADLDQLHRFVADAEIERRSVQWFKPCAWGIRAVSAFCLRGRAQCFSFAVNQHRESV
jgi:hypothetical protein